MKRYNVYEDNNLIYFQLPKVLVKNEKYRSQLSNDDILAFTLCLERIQYSAMNGLFNEHGEIYFFFKQEEFSKNLDVSVTTVKRILSKLEKLNLISYERTGRANRLYLNKPDVEIEDINQFIYESQAISIDETKHQKEEHHKRILTYQKNRQLKKEKLVLNENERVVQNYAAQEAMNKNVELTTDFSDSSKLPISEIGTEQSKFSDSSKMAISENVSDSSKSDYLIDQIDLSDSSKLPVINNIYNKNNNIYNKLFELYELQEKNKVKNTHDADDTNYLDNYLQELIKNKTFSHIGISELLLQEIIHFGMILDNNRTIPTINDNIAEVVSVLLKAKNNILNQFLNNYKRMYGNEIKFENLDKSDIEKIRQCIKRVYLKNCSEKMAREQLLKYLFSALKNTLFEIYSRYPYLDLSTTEEREIHSLLSFAWTNEQVS